MSDLDKLTDEELLALEQQALSQSAPSSDLDSLSDEELLALEEVETQKHIERGSEKKEVSMIESAFRGAVDTFSLGFADEATSKVESLVTGRDYETVLAETRQAYKDAQDANPVSFVAGQIGGGVVGVGKILGAVKGFKAAALSGLAAGGIEGFGSSEEDDLEGIASDVATGAAWGLGGGIIGAGIASRFAKSATNLKSTASKLEKSMGAYNGSSSQLLAEKISKKGLDVDKFVDNMHKMVDIDGKNLLKTHTTRGALVDAADAARMKAGRDIGAVYTEVSDEIGDVIDPKMVSHFLKNKLLSNETLQKYINNPEIPGADKQLKEVLGIVDSIALRKKNYTVNGLKDAKQLLIDTASDGYWKLSEPMQALERAADELLVKTVENYSKRPDAKALVSGLKEQYHTLATFTRNAKGAAEKEVAGGTGRLMKIFDLASRGGMIKNMSLAASKKIIGGTMSVFSKNPNTDKVTAKALRTLSSKMDDIDGQAVFERLGIAAGLSVGEFKEQLIREEFRSEGGLPMDHDKAPHIQKVKSSGEGAKLQMKWLNDIFEKSMTPNYSEAQGQQPFFKEFQPKPRGNNGRKINE